MKIPDCHSWRVTPREAVRIQKDLGRRLVFRPPKKPIRILAAGEVAYRAFEETTFAAVLLFRYPDLTLLESVSATGKTLFPYIPGLLTFREAPVLMQAFSRLSVKPDVILLDGQGVAHPRSMGIAAHLGFLLNLPSIGCAKSRLCGTYEEPGLEKGSTASLIDGERTIGTVLRSRTGVKPVFVSPGHRMDIATSIRIVLSLCHGYRIPEPLRQAHICVSRLRSNFKT